MKKTLTLMVLTLGTFITCYAQKAKIQLKLKQDSTYYLNQSSNLTITQDIPGQKQVITTIITGLVAHKVTAIKDTTYELTVQYENIGMKMDMAGNTLMSVDTKNKDSQDIMTKIMRNMLHKSITVIVTCTGKVLAIKNLDNLYSGLFNGFPEVPDAKRAQIKAQVEKSFGEKAFKNSFQDAFAMLPDAPVDVNDTWISNTILETVAVAKIKTTYALKSITGPEYVIHGDALVTSAGTGDFLEYNGIPVRYNNVKGTYTVDIKLDKATGWVTDSRVIKKINGDLEIKDNPKVPGGATFPMSIEGNVNLSNK